MKEPCLLSIASSIDRSVHGDLANFDSLLLDDSRFSDACTTALGAPTTKHQMSPRKNVDAKTETDRDACSTVLRNFVDSLISSVVSSGQVRGVTGAARDLGLDRMAISRYHNNCSAKRATLTSASVATLERHISDLMTTPGGEQSIFVPTAEQKVTLRVWFKIEGRKSKPAIATGSRHSWKIRTPLGSSHALVAKVATGAQLQKATPLCLNSQSGGACSVHAMGESVFSPDWVLKSQNSDGGIYLRKGFRCRKLFQKASNSNHALVGRLFEWYIVEDRNPMNAGRPKFVLHELLPDAATGLLVRSTHKWYGSGKSAPQIMWDQMYKCGKGGKHKTGTNNGIRLCGFDDDHLLEMLSVADECDWHGHSANHLQSVLGSAGESSLPESKVVVEPHTFKKRFHHYRSRALRLMVQHGNEQFSALVSSLCPSDPEKAAGALLESATFQKRWLKKWSWLSC